MKFKKALFVLTSVVMAAQLTACSSGPAESSSSTAVSDSGSQSSEVEAKAEPFGKYDPPIELHFVRSTDDTIETNVLANYPNQTIEDNFWLDTYEEELGIKVVYDWIVKGGDEYNQKLNVTLASGDIPDVMSVNASQLSQLADSELIQDLGSIYDSYAADFTKDVMNQEGNAPFLAGQQQGIQYGLPVTAGSADGCDLMWIRTDWLEKLNMETPTTMDGVMEMLDKFMEADFDGNGKKDTVGISISGTDLWGGYGGLRGFFNAYNAYPGIWVENNGKLAYGSTLPEAKTALTVLHEMYQKGYIDPEFGVKDSAKAGESAAAGLNGFSFGAQWISLWPLQSCKDNYPDCQWSAFPIPKSGETDAKAQVSMGTSSWLVANKNCEHPEALVKMINLFIEKCWGETGDNGKYYAPPEAEGVWKLSPVQPSPPNKNIDAFLEIDAARKAGDTSKLTGESRSIQDKLDSYASGSKDGFALWGWERIYGEDPSSYSAIVKLQNGGNILMDKFVGAPTEVMTEKLTTLKKMQDEVYTKIILGESSIDEFDKFVEDFMTLGGQEITDEVNDWYSSAK